MKTLKESLLGNAGLDKKSQVEKWLQEMGIQKYSISDDYKGNYLIDVYDNVYLYNKELKQFPSYIKFNHISGDFICKSNNLKSLKGCPLAVRGCFDCSYNELTSLEGGPEVVDGTFNCNDNKLKTLEYLPKKMGYHLWCTRNKLESLEGCPDIVYGDFDCSFNNLESLKGCPREVHKNFYCMKNKLKSLKGCPKMVKGIFLCWGNSVQFKISDVLKLCKFPGKSKYKKEAYIKCEM